MAQCMYQWRAKHDHKLSGDNNCADSYRVSMADVPVPPIASGEGDP
jgi:hypothetical protein